jgi:hypothetical protein
MSNDTTTEEFTPVDEVEAADVETGSEGEALVPADRITAQEAKLVGDEEIAAAADEAPVAVAVNDADVAHATIQPREADKAVAAVHETAVRTDIVITDPSDPRAVQIPDAGRGDATTPIARAYANGAETVEDVFAKGDDS